MVKLAIERALITKKYVSPKSGKTYLTITDGESEINASAGDLDPAGIPLLEPVKLDASIKCSLYGKNQNLTLLSLNLARVEGK